MIAVCDLRLGACAGLLGVLAACSSPSEPQPDRTPSAASPAEAQAAPPSAPAKPFATPKVRPPPAPEGTVLLEEPWLYVQACSSDAPCETLTQLEGETHCMGLRLGGRSGWRLPSRHEVERLEEGDGLERVGGYHWTRTPWEEDVKQVWVVDPKGSGPPTTLPRDRKPFTIRCVAEP